uniref:Uncharacterized protein n=1 Tax=Thalassia hemprichii TaxID=55496 RepID=A0A4Y1KCM0_9LILI|nr:hypothetical protein [Thalassia hemprichii]ATP74900.1 hypothetical protein [Thalassia hemprichii]
MGIYFINTIPILPFHPILGILLPKQKESANPFLEHSVFQSKKSPFYTAPSSFGFCLSLIPRERIPSGISFGNQSDCHILIGRDGIHLDIHSISLSGIIWFPGIGMLYQSICICRKFQFAATIFFLLPFCLCS